LLYKGYNGNLVLTDRGVVIRRGAKGFVLQLSVRGEKEIPYDSIVAVQFKRAGVTAGYIQLSLRGGSEAKHGLTEAVRDENTVTFQRTTAKLEEARDIIKSRVDATKRPSTPLVANGHSRDAAAQLSEIAALHQQGLLTEEEFLTAKTRLLNQL
jgi:hypothetical protein